MKIVTGYKNLYVVSFSIYSVSTAVVLLSIRVNTLFLEIALSNRKLVFYKPFYLFPIHLLIFQCPAIGACAMINTCMHNLYISDSLDWSK